MARMHAGRRRALAFTFILILLLAACGGAPVEEPPAEAPAAVNRPPTPTLRAGGAGTEMTVTAELSPAAEATDGPTLTPPATATAEPTATMAPTLTPTTPPVTINGTALDSFIVMPEETRRNVRQIFTTGQALGRDAERLSILGDSLIATPQSLAKWDEQGHALGEYHFLQPTLDRYAGQFGRYGVSVRVGLHSWSVFDPLWADKDYCQPNEDLLACELRLNNPSVMFVFLGSNDAGSPGGFNVNYRQVVDTLLEAGVVPILATKADRFEGDNANNEIIRKVAAEYALPLLEFDLLADTLPGRGLSEDGVHLTYLEPLDYTSSEVLARGYPVHNLASLIILDQVRREIAAVEG